MNRTLRQVNENINIAVILNESCVELVDFVDLSFHSHYIIKI